MSPATRRERTKGFATLTAPGRIAQRESARFTRERSLVRSQVRPLGDFHEQFREVIGDRARCDLGMEGVVAKKLTCRYGSTESGRVNIENPSYLRRN